MKTNLSLETFKDKDSTVNNIVFKNISSFNPDLIIIKTGIVLRNQ